MGTVDKVYAHMRVQHYGTRKDTHSSSKRQLIFDEYCNSHGITDPAQYGYGRLWFQKEQIKDYLGAFVTPPEGVPGVRGEAGRPWSLEIEINALEPSPSTMKGIIQFCRTCGYKYFDLAKLEVSRPNCRMCDFLYQVFESCVSTGFPLKSKENDDFHAVWYHHIWPLTIHWRCGNDTVWTELDIAQKFAEIPSGGLVLGASNESIETVSTWLRDCDCYCENSNATPYLPTRLLEVSGSPSSPSVRLRETQDGIPLQNSFRYIALSHCWGPKGSPRLITTDDNLQARKLDIPWAEIPKTFQDALVFTCLIGVKYLWIDSLCIIQGQHDLQDWRIESGKMADIYSRAYLTISAASAAHANVGLFRDMTSDVLARPSMQVPAESSAASGSLLMYAKKQLHFFDTREQDYPLLSRAWAYQERYLSPRNLFFFNNELVWVCQSATWKEKSNGHLTTCIKEILADNDTREKIYPQDQWHKCVSEYSKLRLTFEKDRLPAIGGIAAQMECKRESRYFAGIWSDSLCYDLAWSTVDNFLKPTSKQAPTWSWASAPGEVRFNYQPSRWSVRQIATVLDIHCDYLGPSPMGEIVGGYLKLSAPFIHGRDMESEWWKFLKMWEYSKQLFWEDKVPLGPPPVKPCDWEFRLDYAIPHENTLRVDIDFQSDDIILLQLCEFWSSKFDMYGWWIEHLILKKVPMDNVYERVGLASFIKRSGSIVNGPDTLERVHGNSYPLSNLDTVVTIV